MSKPKVTPKITKELILYLEERFPLSAFPGATSITDLYFLKGVESVKGHLRALHEHQERT